MIHPVDYAPSQDFGDNPTKNLPADHWIIKQFGNYQPDGHTGTDYPCPSGTPVRAVTAGKVLHVGRIGGTYANNAWWIQPGFAGFFYAVDHGGFIGIYGHCLAGGARVTVGQQVTEGQVLGLSGNTGASTGDHLHFEILVKPFILNSYMYGRSNPAILFGGSITPQGNITPSEEDDMAYSEADLSRIMKEAIDGWSMDVRRFAGNRNALDTFAQAQTERAAILAAVKDIPTQVLFENRVNGRNLVDQNIHTQNLISGIAPGGAVDVGALAKALAEQLPQADAEALVDALATRLAGGVK